MNSLTEIETLYGHSDFVNSIAFHNSEMIILSGSNDTTIKL